MPCYDAFARSNDDTTQGDNMSVHRENVTWQSKDGKWNIGFWDFYDTKDCSDPDYDYEWDVEYHNDRFWFVSQGHSTPEAAYEAYCRYHANPGGTLIVPYFEEDVAKYEEYAANFRAANKERSTA